MRPVGVGDAPVAHRAGGIEPSRLGEGADGLAVVKAVDQAKSLIEVGLSELSTFVVTAK